MPQRQGSHTDGAGADVDADFSFGANHVGQLVFCDRDCLDFCGHLAGELVGTAFTFIIHPDDRAVAADAWRQAVIAKEASVFEARLRNAEGRYLPFRIRGAHARTDDEIDYWVCACTQISAGPTDRPPPSQAPAAARASTAGDADVGASTGGHCPQTRALTTELTAIADAASLILEIAGDERVLALADHIKAAAARAAALTPSARLTGKP